MEQMNEDKLARIARLSGLSLSEKEKEILASDMARIVPYMERITKLDTSAVSESAETEQVPEEMPLREDVAVDAGLAEAILAEAPVHGPDAFVVPQAVE